MSDGDGLVLTVSPCGNGGGDCRFDATIGSITESSTEEANLYGSSVDAGGDGDFGRNSDGFGGG